ncbi:hypothetical protein CI238_13465, partial [Colletotrichum incanum]
LLLERSATCALAPSSFCKSCEFVALARFARLSRMLTLVTEIKQHQLLPRSPRPAPAMPPKAAPAPAADDAAPPPAPKTTRKRTGGAAKPPAAKKAKGKKRASRGATRVAPCAPCVRRLAADKEAERCADQLGSGQRCAQCADGGHTCPGPISDAALSAYQTLDAAATAFEDAEEDDDNYAALRTSYQLAAGAAGRALRPDTRANAAAAAPAVVPAPAAAASAQPAAAAPAARAPRLPAPVYLFSHEHAERFVAAFELFARSYAASYNGEVERQEPEGEEDGDGEGPSDQ